MGGLMPNYDYRCSTGHVHEVRCRIADKPEETSCPECGAESHHVFLTAPAMPTHIVVDYPGSKKFKAGYTHTHGDRKGTKIQVGAGGKITRSEEPKATGPAIWKNPLA